MALEGLEPPPAQGGADFESAVSANSTTGPCDCELWIADGEPSTAARLLRRLFRLLGLEEGLDGTLGLLRLPRSQEKETRNAQKLYGRPPASDTGASEW